MTQYYKVSVVDKETKEEVFEKKTVYGIQETFDVLTGERKVHFDFLKGFGCKFDLAKYEYTYSTVEEAERK